MSRRSSRVKKRIDYHEMNSTGERRSSYSVFERGIIAESETTELNDSGRRVYMPLPLRERDLNVEESTPLKTSEYKDGEEIGDDFEEEDVVEVIEEETPDTRRRIAWSSIRSSAAASAERLSTSAERLSARASEYVSADTLRDAGESLRASASQVGETLRGAGERAGNALRGAGERAGNVLRGSGAGGTTATDDVVDDTPVPEHSGMSQGAVILLAVVNATVLAFCVTVFTMSPGPEQSLSSLLSNPGVEVNESSNPWMPKTQFYSTLRQLQADRERRFQESARESLRQALKGVTGVPTFQEEEPTEFTVDDVVRDASEILAAGRAVGPDFALYSAGARVLSAEPSRLDQLRGFLFSRFTSLLGRQSDSVSALPNPPATALEEGISPGECWAFSGAQAKLSIQLARPAMVKSVAIEHAPAAVVPSVRSAPRDFKIFAYNPDSTETLLGEFAYDAQLEETYQEFALSEPRFASAVRLEITSNHGEDYTCLYRFRAHGAAT